MKILVFLLEIFCEVIDRIIAWWQHRKDPRPSKKMSAKAAARATAKSIARHRRKEGG